MLGELIKGSRDSNKISAIPPGTELIQVFWVEDTQTLLLDFNSGVHGEPPRREHGGVLHDREHHQDGVGEFSRRWPGFSS